MLDILDKMDKSVDENKSDKVIFTTIFLGNNLPGGKVLQKEFY